MGKIIITAVTGAVIQAASGAELQHAIKVTSPGWESKVLDWRSQHVAH